MERVSPTQKGDIKSDILSAWAAISNGVVDANNRSRGNIGNTGVTIPKPSHSLHTTQNAQTPNSSSSSQPLLQGSGQVTTAEEILSEFQQLRKHWQPSQRPLNWLENTR